MANLLQVSTEGKRPFVLLAVIRHRSASAPADYVYGQLPAQVKKALSAAPQESPGSKSPLHSSFLRVCEAFKKLSAYAESIFAYTETVAALLDLKTMALHTVSFGDGALAPYVARSDGAEVAPDRTVSHYCDNHTVTDSSYEAVSGQHYILLGSPGLWYATPFTPASTAVSCGEASPQLSH